MKDLELFDQSGENQDGGLVRKKVFKKKHCAPGKDTTDGSCLDEDLIKKIAKIVNLMRNKDKDLPEIKLIEKELAEYCYQ